ncbi:MAG: outer membrane beta-barrel protein, partial [Rhodospirillaceae bacterium]|nr:outer membrane beta-barrel protein [Rhodospirillaceae bacterium]
KLFGDVFGGYRRQDYEDTTLAPIDGATYGGALTWNATGLTTVKASVTRNVVETTQVGASGYFSTKFKGSVDHELLRNLILGGYGSFTINDYEGNGRDDEDIETGVYARYLMQRNLHLSAGYDYQQRESNFVGGDFKKNVFMLRLSAQF